VRLALTAFCRKAYRVLRNPNTLYGYAKRVWVIQNDRKDFLAFKKASQPYRGLITKMPQPDQGCLLFVSGPGMLEIWAQIWSVLSISARLNKIKPCVLTFKNEVRINRYFKLLDVNLIYWDELFAQGPESMPPDLAAKVEICRTQDEYRGLSFNNIPLGEIALSTEARYGGHGVIDLCDEKVRENINNWIQIVYKTACVTPGFLKKYDIRTVILDEGFQETYGAIYFSAVNAGITVIKNNLTVRDNAFIFQRRSNHTVRLHHASLAKSSWAEIRNMPDIDRVNQELAENFSQRYGSKWGRSMRNQPNAKIVDPAKARSELGVPVDRKIAVIYSHILYDTVFFFGTDLFKDYATWLIETIRVAIVNDQLEWFIKVHPSNIWRGEMSSLLGGRYEEERLIEKNFGALPQHVHIVSADSPISPLAWMKLADFGVTVRGTAGLEMASLGRTVITAGTGRYEGHGFTCDPKTVDAYLGLLKKLPNIPEITNEQTHFAQLYAYGVFILKPFTLESVVPRLRLGRSRLVASDDLIYIPRELVGGDVPGDLRRVAAYLADENQEDLLTHVKSI
jgi:hypothetical protein